MAKPVNNKERSEKTEYDPRRFVTPTFRVSYPAVFKAKQVLGKGEPKYSVTMLFPKTTDLSKLKLAMKHAKVEKFGENPKKWPENLQSPVVDGDSQKHAGKDGYKGHWVIKASSSEKYKPGLIDENMDEIVNQADFYPGCYARAEVFCFGWKYMGKTGVSFSLNNIQKVKDGKPFGGRKSAAEVFGASAIEEMDDDADQDGDYENDDADQDGDYENDDTTEENEMSF